MFKKIKKGQKSFEIKGKGKKIKIVIKKSV
jgi:hypothetical protein